MANPNPKPSPATQFKPGPATNPTGRPKTYKEFKQWCHQQVISGGREEILKIAQSATTLFGKDGIEAPDYRTRLMAWRFMVEYAYGQPKQSVDVDVTQRVVRYDRVDDWRPSLPAPKPSTNGEIKAH